MAEQYYDSSFCNEKSFKEAVCIDVPRLYDSCGDKDCLEDLRVYFTDCTQPIIDDAVAVKVKCVEVLHVLISVEPVPFNKGFYSVDLTYFFGVKLNAFSCPLSKPTCVDGLAVFCKKVVLFGNESNVRVFSNSGCKDKDIGYQSVPNVTVQVAEPMVLSSCVHECPEINLEGCKNVPKNVAHFYEGSFECVIPQKVVEISLGIFSIIQMERQVQMLVPIYDFCIPQKECITTSDNPCDVFKKIKFPIDEFFPPKANKKKGSCDCQNAD